MSLQIIKNIDIDFYDKKYVLINAKQFDRSSRYLLVTCYNNGEVCVFNTKQHSAYIRYKKSDNYSVFNSCEINDDGKILVELTEQMLAASGICVADLVVTSKGTANIDTETGEIVSIDNSSIISTMTFYIDVSEVAANSSNIESAYEINIINQTLEKYEANYENVVKTAKSWAVGETGLRSDENTNNARYWSEVAAQNATGVPIVVTGIKCTNDTEYRSGQVTIGTNDIGAVSVENIATVNEVKNYLGIE